MKIQKVPPKRYTNVTVLICWVEVGGVFLSFCLSLFILQICSASNVSIVIKYIFIQFS